MEETISILIPCFNSATYLPDLFEGIRKQTIPFDEIICYDDCSTDNTIEVATQLGAKVIIGKENKGPAFARNRLIEASTSKWIHFHDSDDLIEPKFVATVKRYIIDENTQFLCNTHILDRNTRTTNYGDVTYSAINDCEDQLAYFLDNVGFASMGLYSKKALNTIGGFREDIKANEDPDLHVRLVKNGFNIKSIPDFLVTKLEHDTSFSHQNWMMCMVDKLTCYESYLTSFDKKYTSIIGNHLAITGAYFYTHHNLEAGKKALILVKKAGVKAINTSRFSTFFTNTFGIELYYNFLYLRNKFNL